MIHAMKHAIAGVATVAVATGSAPAATLHPEWVSAAATWVAHLDIEAFVGSEVGGYLLEHGDAHGIHWDGLDEFEAETGLDPREDLMSVTIYGDAGGQSAEVAGERDGNPVLVLVTSARVDDTLAALREDPDSGVEIIRIGDHRAYAFEWDGEPAYLHAGPGPVAEQRVLLMAGTPDRLLDAIGVVEGRRPGLPGSIAPIAQAAPATGSIFFASLGDVPRDADMDPVAEITRMSKRFDIDLGEHDGRVFVVGRADARDAEQASDVAQVVQGTLALFRLGADECPELAPLLAITRGIAVTTDDRNVKIDARYSAERIIDAMRESAAAGTPDDR